MYRCLRRHKTVNAGILLTFNFRICSREIKACLDMELSVHFKNISKLPSTEYYFKFF